MSQGHFPVSKSKNVLVSAIRKHMHRALQKKKFVNKNENMLHVYYR